MIYNKESYFKEITEHFMQLDPEKDFSEDVLRFFRYSLLNYTAGSIFAAKTNACRALL